MSMQWPREQDKSKIARAFGGTCDCECCRSGGAHGGGYGIGGNSKDSNAGTTSFGTSFAEAHGGTGGTGGTDANADKDRIAHLEELLSWAYENGPSTWHMRDCQQKNVLSIRTIAQRGRK